MLALDAILLPLELLRLPTVAKSLLECFGD
jgi:hypothetical protein